MDDFKRQHFMSTNPGEKFPDSTPLSDAECSGIRRNIAIAVGEGEASGVQLVKDISDRLVPDLSASALDGSFRVASLLRRHRLPFPCEVLINWDDFTNIDRIGLAELDEFWEYIWYPSSDDIDVIDSGYRWMVSIDHDGRVGVLVLGQSDAM
ncbi:MAG TPA: hypothetical protein PLL69_12110 [Gemmatimonadales bacterium]|nr:hypothetical protein [Gemmatimonadales bacterium]